MTATDHAPVECGARGEFALLTLRRPQVLNAIDVALRDALLAAWHAAEREDRRGIILTGAGRAFCAGTDLKNPPPDIDAHIDVIHRLLLAMRRSSLVSVAALNGLALGGGLELALACTFRVAAPDATFGLPEIRLGVMPCYGATQLLPRLIGEGRALDLMLSGRSIDAATALSWGLIDKIADDPVAAAAVWAEARTGRAPVAEQAIRRAVDHAFSGLPEALREEQRLAREVRHHPATRSALASFRDRRRDGAG
ncbi:enoyl-CoA hydratase/isomerase family protein [Sphingomonas sp.]|uniref:enoyl-CoA hydratase/isomerase family protein n=1 Tax=Sphingomonas sp. TaxID=28214 RepID=UPI002DD69D9F|nr:enoyl-CoA hydratase/isomerase family protein [Sphingomonas sp.]